MAAPFLDSSTLHLMLSHAPGFILYLNAERIICYVNKVVPMLSIDDVIGQPYNAFHGPEQVARLRRAFDAGEETGEEQIVENCMDFENGLRLWFETRLAPLRDDAGALVGWVNFTSDITERKNAEADLKRVQRELMEASRRAGMAEVATGVLHNVGNVLNSVNISASALLELMEASRARLLARVVEMMEHEGERLAEFLADDPRGRKIPELLARLGKELVAEQAAMRTEAQRLLDHVHIIRSTIEAQQSIAQPGTQLQPASPAELVSGALSMFRVELGERAIDISLHVEHAEPVLVDKQAVLQILVNLVGNAIDAFAGMDGPHALAIRVRADGEALVFEVTDSGCGITADNLTRIFDHGFTTKPHGHGFGLHASAAAAQSMGGSLTARSDGPGRGACFRLSLPLRAASDLHA